MMVKHDGVDYGLAAQRAYRKATAGTSAPHWHQLDGIVRIRWVEAVRALNSYHTHLL
jgi:hypothetical protein